MGARGRGLVGVQSKAEAPRHPDARPFGNGRCVRVCVRVCVCVCVVVGGMGQLFCVGGGRRASSVCLGSRSRSGRRAHTRFHLTCFPAPPSTNALSLTAYCLFSQGKGKVKLTLIIDEIYDYDYELHETSSRPRKA